MLKLKQQNMSSVIIWRNIFMTSVKNALENSR
jgi:hypothetical protein